MAQRPTADYPIDANTTSGTDLSLILNRFQTALESGNSGSSRPAYITAGGLWVKEGDPMELYLYDGTADRLLYDTSNGINVNEGLWTLVDENDSAGEIQRPSDVLIDGNLTVTGEVVDGDGNPISIIDAATEDGVVATWDNTAKQWTPDSSLTIDGSGDATFSGDISAVNVAVGSQDYRPSPVTVKESSGRCITGYFNSGGFFNIGALADSSIFNYSGPNGKLVFRSGSFDSGDDVLTLDATGNATFSGTVTVEGNRPVISTRDLIDTLSTLRNATKDEETLEGLRDAISDAIGGLIQKFEAIQAEAKEKLEEAYNQTGTQEITPDNPEVGTMDD